MSLIERAVSRSAKPARSNEDQSSTADVESGAQTESRIEQAIARAVAAVDDGEAVAHGAKERRPGRLGADRHEFVSTRREPSLVWGSGDGAELDAGSDVGKGLVVELDLQRLSAAGMITPDAEKSALAEEFRMIKRPLIANAMGRGASRVHHRNLIMITSAMPGEGKTFSAVNLAISMAMERDYTVLLVDADVARPGIHQMLALPRKAGLMDVLVGEKRLNEVILGTNIDKLRILPAGHPHRHATELLASGAMAQLLEELATRYADRIVIFDSPPLLATSEARALATQMGQVVLVVEEGRTTHQAVEEALREVEACEIVGLVYNKARVGGDLYGYYNYGYGTYGQ